MSTIRTAADAIRRGDVQLTDINRSEGMPDADMALIDLLDALARADDEAIAIDAVTHLIAAINLAERLATAITRRGQR